MMDPDMFAEDPSFNEKFDIDFEFDAPRFYDFSKPELDSETELWFESAGNYPPSRKISIFFDNLMEIFVLLTMIIPFNLSI